MGGTDIQAKVTVIVADTILEASGRTVDLKPDTSLMSTGYLDSLAVIQLFTRLQEEFDVELDVEDLTEEKFGSPQAIAQLIEERI